MTTIYIIFHTELYVGTFFQSAYSTREYAEEEMVKMVIDEGYDANDLYIVDHVLDMGVDK